MAVDISVLLEKIRNEDYATGEEMRVWIAETFEALESGLIKTSTAISSGGNLNNYADPGDYYCDSTTICNSLTNCPVTNRVFFLAVKQSSVTSYRRVQILIAHYTSTSASYGGGKPSIYTRARYTASSWGAWVQVYTSNDTIPGIAEAQTTASEAKTTATSAQATASEAKNTASIAQTTASEAKTTATSAQATANEAMTIAQNADAAPFEGLAIDHRGDLNSYTKPGLYHCISAVTCNSLLNCPVSSCVFSLQVLVSSADENKRTQLLIAHGTSVLFEPDSVKPSIWVRSKYSSSYIMWSDWVRVYTSNDGLGNSYYGTCSTAEGTTEKVVVCSGFVLAKGARIAVYFTRENVAKSPTLNVGGSGAKDIVLSSNWEAGSAVDFVYDGDVWRMVTPMIQKNYTGICPTAAGTVAKIANCAEFASGALVTGTRISVLFTNANTASGPTLNVNGTGAYPIYKNGAAAGTGAWNASQLVFFVFFADCWHID